MNEQRLSILAHYLENFRHARSSFNLVNYGRTVTVPGKRLAKAGNKKTFECGTVCCAAGHACFVDELKGQGLHLVWEGSESVSMVAYKEHTGISALAEFFDLSPYHVHEIFFSGGYCVNSAHITPQMVAEKIRNILWKPTYD